MTQASGGEGVLIVRRPPAMWRDRLRSYHVRVDGRDSGELRPHDQLELTVAPGEHTVQVKVGIGGSNEMRLEVKPGQALVLDVRPNGPAPMALVQFARPNSWLKLTAAH